MKTAPSRLLLYPTDIMRITGKSMRSAYRLIKAIKLRYNIRKRVEISVEQFCGYTGLSEEKVNKFIV